MLLFGAGNIGRSFIGQLFARAGYEVVFVDINDRIIDGLNREGRYRVIIKANDKPDETIWVSGVRGINGRDTAKVIEAVATADIMATSVGKKALSIILPTIAKGLQERFKTAPKRSVDIIMAENIRYAADFYTEELVRAGLSLQDIKSSVGLIETSIGKMVPIMSADDVAQDPLWVFAEPYNTLIVDGLGFKTGVPDIPGLSAKKNIGAYVDRKLFIHNLGHAASAYLGYQADKTLTYVWEALERPEILATVRRAMQESACALAKEYPKDLLPADLSEHIEDLISRFRNRALGDTIFRVGRDLYRKLARDDRLIGALLLAEKHGCPTDAIIKAATAAFEFRATDEKQLPFPEDAQFWEREGALGREHVLTKVSGLNPAISLDSRIIRKLS